MILEQLQQKKIYTISTYHKYFKKIKHERETKNLFVAEMISEQLQQRIQMSSVLFL